MQMQQIERPQSLTEMVSNQLRNSIIEGELELGELLSEAKISMQLKVSRSPVRAAFIRLEQEGLLHSIPQRGTFVFTSCEKGLLDICEVRMGLESTAFRLAIARQPQELLHDLQGILAKMTEARATRNNAYYLRLDSEFHQIIVNNSDNEYLKDAYKTIASKMATLRLRLKMTPHLMEQSYQDHKIIVEWVKNRELEKILELLVTHVRLNRNSALEMGTISQENLS